MAASALFTLCRTVRSLSASANIRTRAFYHWATARRTIRVFKSGRASVLFGVPTLFLLQQRVRGSAAVLALDTEEVLEQADYLYGCAETDKLYQLLLQHKDRDDAEFLWRLARATRDVSRLPDTVADRKKQLVYEAHECAKRALERDESCFAAHKWYAICLSDIGDYEGVKVKLGNAYVIRDHLQRAIELNPKDATSMHILGYWCFAFAELPWYQRKVAAIIFATPPTATYEEAVDYFLKAEEVDPNFYSKNLLLLGQTYLRMNDKDRAKLWLSKAKEYPPHTNEDKEVHKEAVDLLKSLG
ncbi:regulator of microtubule dynamics protein 1 [Eucyclogobius newberryi]|uniref:regulator of microtubule dynamics protein 1 n=1 Tax=Eucyclogobius newberryi TaxID=166745 RepID=UPI003B5ABD3F